ncbi:MAG: ATP-binding protein [Thermacetogeniaceae bacterium]
MSEDWLTRRKSQMLSFVTTTHLAGLLLCTIVLVLMGLSPGHSGQITAHFTWVGLVACLLLLYWAMTGYLHKNLLTHVWIIDPDLVAYALLALLFALAAVLFAGENTAVELLLLVPVIIAATSGGRLPGMITAAVAGGFLTFVSILGASPVSGQSRALAADLIFTGLALLVGWLIGGLGRVDTGSPYDSVLGCTTVMDGSAARKDNMAIFSAELQSEIPERRYLDEMLQSQQHILVISTALENARLFEEARRAYERLDHLQQQLLQAQKLEAQGQLAAGVAHEVNNQLTVIQGCVDFYCRHHGQDEALLKAFGRIHKAAEVSANLIRKMMLCGRQVPQCRTPVNLNQNVAELGETLQQVLTPSMIALNIQLAEDLWLVSADCGNIDQVVVNLAVNARDAMPQGGAITIETRNLILDGPSPGQPEVTRTGRFVCLSVSDTGAGMDEETLSRLFEPFYTTKQAGKGTGLGLSVAHSIVNDHDGWFNVRSHLGQGSHFEIYLPALQ